MSEKYRLKSSIKYPTSLIIGGNDFFAVELAKTLVEQGGYVVVVDHDVEHTKEIYERIENQKLLSFINFDSIDYLDDDLRRLDYVFFLSHEFDYQTLEISSREFLQASNYLDLIIDLTLKYKSKFLMTSSIKAHQVLLNSYDEINYGKLTNDQHRIFTQMEVQRYSEALVIESCDKKGLDARILRMGRVIGPNMKFDEGNSLDRLVMQAVKGKNFRLEADGLATNMYVHVLDAAYGVIKAMFTKGTKSKIYTLANEEEITDLSIAYKLQEMTGLDQEIRFEDKGGIFPMMGFYKSAQNLSVIDWKPKVSFHRALAQVYDYARDIIIKKEQEQIDQKQNENIEETESDSYIDDDTGEPKGALARLIAERKAQEKARRGSILMANEKIKETHKKKRKLSAFEKFQKKVQRVYDTIAFKFSFLKKITIIEALIYLVLLVIFAVVYIGVISPIFVIGKDILVIQYNQKELKQNLENEKYSESSDNVSKISTSITSVKDNFAKLEPLYVLTQQEDQFEKTDDTLKALDLYAVAINEVFVLNKDFTNYYQNSDPGLLYRPNASSLIEPGPAKVDANQLAYLKANRSKYEQNMQRIETTYSFLSQNSSLEFFGYDFDSLQEEFSDMYPVAKELNSVMATYSEMVLSDNIYTYAFVLQDNSRFTPAGGFPSAVGYFKIQDGQIIDADMQIVSEAEEIDSLDLSQAEIDEIQMTASEFVTREEITFNDLFLLTEKSRIDESILSYTTEKFAVQSDAIIYLNLETIANLLDKTGPIDLNQVNITSSSILSSIDLLQAGDKSIDKRNEIIANIFALQLDRIVKDKISLYHLAETISDAYLANGIEFSSDVLDLDIEKSDQSLDSTSTDNWLEVYALIDSEALDIELFPSINLTIKDKILKDNVNERQVSIKAGNIKNIERVVVCMPPLSSNFEFEDDKLSLAQAFSQDKICVAGDIKGNETISYSYELDYGIDNLINNKYNVDLGLKKSPGINMIYDLEISEDTSMNFTDSGDLYLSNGKLIISGALTQDKLINIKLEK